MEQLKVNGLKDQLQCPFLISLYRSGLKGEEEREKAKKADPCWYLKKGTPEHEEWYTKAEIKIMFFGQEPHRWKMIWIRMQVTLWLFMKISLMTSMW